MSHISDSIRAVNARGRKGIIPYLPSGYPDREHFWGFIAELAENPVVAAIEIGIPFSDPVADGPVVEQAALHCLENGATLGGTIRQLSERSGDLSCPILFMGYTNSFSRYEFERFADDAARAGLSGLIVPDTPLEESGALRTCLNARGIDLVPLIAVNTPRERLEAYAAVAQGFVYCVSLLGTTGERARAEEIFSPELEASLERARDAFAPTSLPLALGFGLSSPAQLEASGACVDAGVIGSALIRHIDRTGEVASFFK